jgi:two-component system CitB family sensor kinase
VEVEVLDEPHDDGGTLLIVVADSGDGLASGTDAEIVFAEGYTTAMRAIRPGGGGLDKVGLDKVGLDGGRRGGGQGLGLALARKLARRRGGDIRILETGMPGGPGAVFMASLPGTTAGAKPDIADRPSGANDGTLSGTAGSGTAGSGAEGRMNTSEKDDHA